MAFQSYHQTEYDRCEDCGARTIKGNHVCLDCLTKRSKQASSWPEEKLTETRSLGYEKGRQQAMADTQNEGILEDVVLIGDSGSDMAEAYDIEHDDKPDFVEPFIKGYSDFTAD